MVDIRGSTATQYRVGTRTQQANGSYAVSWGSLAAGRKIKLQEISQERRQELWGQESKASVLGTLAPGTDVQAHDGFHITAGLMSGLRFRVERVLPRDSTPGAGGADGIRVALELTEETFA